MIDGEPLCCYTNLVNQCYFKRSARERERERNVVSCKATQGVRPYLLRSVFQLITAVDLTRNVDFVIEDGETT